METDNLIDDNVYHAPVERKAKVAHYVPSPADNRSVMEILAELSLHSPKEYEEVVETLIAEKGEDWVKNLRFDWSVNARPKQMIPQPFDAWRFWVCLAGRGWGKLIPLTTLIPTTYGWKLMKYINIGDKLFDEQGKICKVIQTHPIQTPKKAYRFYFSDGSTIDSGEEHLWATWTRQDRKMYRRSSYEEANDFPTGWINWKVKHQSAHVWLDKNKVKKALELSKQGLSVRKIEKLTGAGRQALAKHIKAGKFLEKPIYEYGFDRIRTTAEVVDSLYCELSDGRFETNHCIPNTRPLELNYAELEVDPYVLGAWLGDGNSANSGFTQHHLDYPHLRTEIEKVGYICSELHKDNKSFTAYKLQTDLRKINVLNNKHIPDNYLRASIDQRLSLLQGLMDTDGTADKDGVRCEFSQSNEKLAKQVYELIVSLGMSAHISSRIPKLNGKEMKENWRIRFTPNLPVFRLDRKLKRLNFSKTQIIKRYCRYIIKAEEITPVPMRCITVDSPNSMYLIGEQMIPTHNTKTGAETIKQWVDGHPAGIPPLRIALVGATAADVNSVMIAGNSGILSCYPEKEKPHWISTARKLIWSNPDGTEKAIAESFSAEEPERLRGPQFHNAWMDELAAWRYEYALEMLRFGLRLGDNPQAIVTTTPRPLPILLNLLKEETTWTTIGSTYENRSNLAPAFFSDIIKKYQNTTLGRQELMAEIIEEIPNAMWNYDNLDRNRLEFNDMHKLPELLSIVLAIDPATTTRSSSAETGLCVAAYGEDDHFYILHLDAVKESPESWARRAIKLFEDYKCDKMIAEVNNGGDLVQAVIKAANPNQKIHAVHASRGKAEDLNNPILTESGWKTFGTLTNEDKVFTPEGITTSIELLPIHETECAEITFSDGNKGIYALEHEWKVLPYSSVRTFTGANPRIKDWATWKSAGKGNYPRSCTNEMKQHARYLRKSGVTWKDTAEILGVGVGSARRAISYEPALNTCAEFVTKTTQEMMEDNITYMIPNSKPLQFNNTSHIDPYLLGLWLADGCVGSSAITQKTPDDTNRIIKELESRGFELVLRQGIIYVKNMRWAFVGRNKKELFADEWMVREDERLDLIRGFIDGDGTRKSNTSISVSQSGYRMDSVLLPMCDAMRSLGWNVLKPYIKKTIKEPAMTVTINPLVTDCSMFERKNIEFVPHSSRYRTITEIKPVGIKKVRCISVKDDSHLYLSGKGLVPTHNSTRAEPIAALYEQNRVHHLGRFTRGEEQMTSFNPIENPYGYKDMVDALVWAMTWLVDITQGRNAGRPVVGGERSKVNTYKKLFRY